MSDGRTIVVRRTIAAPRERVFDAWIDPALLPRFMLPGDVTHATADVDARVGGRFRILMQHGRGGAEHWGEYLAIDRPARLSFTWISDATDRKTTTVIIELTERPDGGTDLVLTHQGLPERSASAHENGWEAIVTKLGAVVAPSA
jgi:uncharacterized protein YndB with AHSA1/START domain